jgi:hypothetical protein
MGRQMDEDVVLLQSAGSDLGGTVFIKAASAIEGRDTLEEYLACGMHPLSACISFEGITDSVTPVSVLKLPLPKFSAVYSDDEDNIQFLVRVELEAKSVVGSYSCPEHNACVKWRSAEPRIRAGRGSVWAPAGAWY